MYYSNTTRTAVEVVSELIDELDHTKWERQAADSCREVLQLVADCQDLSGTPNPSIVMLCRNKPLPDWATAAAMLLQRSVKAVANNDESPDRIRLNAAEGMMWGVVAVLSILQLQAKNNHPSSRA